MNKYNTCFKLFSMIFSSRKMHKQQWIQQQEALAKSSAEISLSQTGSNQNKNFDALKTAVFLTPTLKPATTDLK